MGFNGFISYSHAADGRLAPAVQRGLHRLAKPWHRRRALWIFRDQTGLSVTPKLWSSIQTALDGSEYFVLLASPEAAASHWVNREIEHWVATKPADRILPVVTDGTWDWDPYRGDFTTDSTSVPHALRGVFGEEPLFLDLRWARDDQHLSLRHSRFRDAIAQLAAPMHGISKDELEGEDVRQYRRERRLRTGAVLALFLLAVAATVTGVLAVHNAAKATASAAEAARQQLVAAEQRGSAQQYAAESLRQQKSAEQQGARAKDAAAEAQRQETYAHEQQTLAEQASAEAGRQQANVKRQQGLADRAALEARQQERIARRESDLAERSAAEARRQEKIAREQQARSEKAAAEAQRQQAEAERQKRIAVGRRLFNLAQTQTGEDPVTALRLGLAGDRIQSDAESRAALVGVARSTRYVGAIDGVSDVAFSPRGILAGRSLTADTVSLWKIEDRAKPVRLSDSIPADSLGAQAFSPDGRTLAVVSRSQATLWNVADPAHPVRIGALSTPAFAISFSPDGRTVMTSNTYRAAPNMTLWDVADPARPAKLSTVIGGTGATVFSPDGNTLMDAGFVWDVTDRAKPVQLTDLPVDNARQMSFAFGSEGHLMASGGRDGAVMLWDLTKPATPQRLSTLNGNGTSAGAIAFSRDGRYLAVGDDSGTVTLWDVTNPRRPAQIDRMTDGPTVNSMAFSPDGRTFISASSALGTSTQAALWSVAAPGSAEAVTDITGLNGSVEAEALRPQAHLLAGVTADGTATFWDVSGPAGPVKRAELITLPRDDDEEDGSIRQAAFSPDARTLAVVGESGRARLWDVSDPVRPVLRSEFQQSSPLVGGASTFSPDGRTLALTDGSNAPVLWDVTDQARPTPLTRLGGDEDGATYAIAFSPDGRTVAVGGMNKKVTVWDVGNRSVPVKLATLNSFTGWVDSVTFSPDGHTMATGSNDGTLILWDVTDRAHPRDVSTQNTVTGTAALAFSPDGAMLAANNGSTTLWDVTNRAAPVQVGALSNNGSRPRVVFSSDGHSVAVAGYDNFNSSAITLWDFSSLNRLRADPTGYACSITGRGFTAEEWTHYIPEIPYQRSCGG